MTRSVLAPNPGICSGIYEYALVCVKVLIPKNRSREKLLTKELQARIDAINWYHEFDFVDGLLATAKTPDVAFHRKLWAFIRATLDTIDFAGKTVLDIGCWDGYWSFYAERRGAVHVLATDDARQNWAGDTGL